MSSEIFVYWGPRRQSLADCSAKVSQHLRVLSQSDESRSNWRAQRGSRKSALKLDAFTYENVSVISSELLKGVNKTDIKPKVIIEELGYRISLWNSAANGGDANPLHSASAVFSGAFRRQRAAGCLDAIAT